MPGQILSKSNLCSVSFLLEKIRWYVGVFLGVFRRGGLRLLKKYIYITQIYQMTGEIPILRFKNVYNQLLPSDKPSWCHY